MRTQLDLMDWAEMQAELTDEPGKCPWCLESSNWLLCSQDQFPNKHGYEEETVYECQTPRYDLDDGSFVELCGKTKTILTDEES